MAALLFALEMISEENKPLSQVIAPLDHRYRSGEINSEVADLDATMQAIERHFQMPGAEIDHLDGMTVSFPDWWFNLRASNTQPLLRLNVEADNKSLLNEKTQQVLAMIRKQASSS
jgi:phosphomannomutase